MPYARTAPWLLVIAGALFSTGGAAIKFCDLGAVQVAGLRAALAVAVLMALVPRRCLRFGPRVIGVAVGYSVMLTLFVASNRFTTAANATFLQAAAPFWLMLLGPLLLGEPLRGRDTVRGIAIALGMALFFVADQSPSATATDPWLGNLLGGAAGLAWGMTILGMRWLARRSTTEPSSDEGDLALSATILGNGICAAVNLTITAGAGWWQPLTGTDAIAIGWLGIFQVGLAYWLLNRAMPHVPALAASLMLMVEPALSPVWAWALHGETAAPLALVGGVLILSAALPWPRRPRRSPLLDG